MNPVLVLVDIQQDTLLLVIEYMSCSMMVHSCR